MNRSFRTGLLSLTVLVASVGCSPSFDRNPPDETAKVQAALSSCSTFGALGDAVLSDPPMGQNFGSLPILRVGGKDEALVQFDLGFIRSSMSIDSATLKLYVSGSDSTAPVNAHRATAPWSESSVTFASFGQHYDLAVLGSLSTTSTNVQKSIDMTSQVRNWTMGSQPNYGVLLETISQKKTIFVSREGGIAGQKPVLEVCFTTPDDHCAPNPCQNGGACENASSGFTCHCQPGYTGETCVTQIDNCAANPCLNGGTCTSGVGSYTCACATGYTGTNCETLIDNCASRPCQNGGVCENGVGTYTCHCPPGYAGANCETLIDNCVATPCENGGTCTNGVNNYSCACAPGFTGTNCEINVDDCASQPCRNGGTCVDGINAFTCSCPPDWGGATCDVNLNSCAQQPCLNGSMCTNGSGTYTCTCATGFTGTNCEIDIDDCTPNPCPAGSICIDGVHRYTCQCSGSVVNFVAPTTPSQLLIGQEATTIFANIVPEGTASGTYSVRSAAFDPPVVSCAIDGSTPGPCTTFPTSDNPVGTYDVSPLTEAHNPHTVTVSGTDCLGNAVSSTLQFYVDGDAPALQTTVTTTAQDASVSIGLTAVDATNVEYVTCLLDSDANGLNPDIDPTAAFGDCPGLAGLPTRPSSSDATPRHYSGTIFYQALAPGNHSVWIRAADYWGHGRYSEQRVDFLVPSVCGNGVVEPGEVCDDGNTSPCGTCSPDCLRILQARATGAIVTGPAAGLQDGATFTLSDGFYGAVTFEFDMDDVLSPGNVPIALSLGDSAATVASRIQNAITSSPLSIDAVARDAAVGLVNRIASSLGNQMIATTVTDTDFLFSGMSGGQGGDCPTGVACAADADCASLDCSGSLRECQ